MVKRVQTQGSLENGITLARMQLEASKGRYYHHKKQQWEPLGSFEQFLRTIWSPCVKSIEKASLQRTWQALEQMPAIPQDIQKRLPDLFKASLYPSNPSSNYSSILCRLYCKSLHSSSTSIHSVHIKQHKAKRSFDVF